MVNSGSHSTKKRGWGGGGVGIDGSAVSDCSNQNAGRNQEQSGHAGYGEGDEPSVLGPWEKLWVFLGHGTQIPSVHKKLLKEVLLTSGTSAKFGATNIKPGLQERY